VAGLSQSQEETKLKIQSYIRSEDGELFDVSINDNETSFTIIELTESEITELINDIKSQVYLLKDAYKKQKTKK
jgi:hypothetical protein